MKLRKLLAAITLSFSLVAPLSGQIISFEFFGAPGNQVSTVGSSPVPEISNIKISRGPGLGPNAGANSINSNGWNTLTEDDFVFVSFEIAPDFSVNLGVLTMTTRSSNTGPSTLGFFSSTDGFTNSLFAFTQSSAIDTITTENLSLTNLTGVVEFRIYSLNSTSANRGTVAATGTFRVNAFSIEGTISSIQPPPGTPAAVPEPSTYGILGALLLAGMIVMRRVRR